MFIVDGAFHFGLKVSLSACFHGQQYSNILILFTKLPDQYIFNPQYLININYFITFKTRTRIYNIIIYSCARMLKQECIEKDYKKISNMNEQTLFCKLTKHGLDIKIIVNDPSIIGEQIAKLSIQEIQANKQIYELTILSSNKDNLRLLRIFNGISGVAQHLQNSNHWLLNVSTEEFSILNNDLKNLQTFKAKKSNRYNVFDFNDFIGIINSQEVKMPNHQKYLLTKAFKIISSNENIKNNLIGRQQIAKNKQSRFKQIERRKQIERKRQLRQSCLKEGQKSGDAIVAKKFRQFNKQLKIFQYIRSDSYGIDDFDFQNCCITKMQQGGPGGERCIFGKNLIKYKNQFTVYIKKLTKQPRDAAIWIGIADPQHSKVQSFEKSMTNVFVMSDRSKICYCSDVGKRKNYCLKNREGASFGLIQFKQHDVITVRVNQQKGEILWLNSKGQQLGGFQSQILKAKLEWVPFIQMWKVGDSINWME